jgi:hypothetical protein
MYMGSPSDADMTIVWTASLSCRCRDRVSCGLVQGGGGRGGRGGTHLKGLLEVQVGEVEDADEPVSSLAGDGKEVEVLDV